MNLNRYALMIHTWGDIYEELGKVCKFNCLVLIEAAF